MTTIDIDGLSEEEFRRSIESRLRQGLAGKAAEKLRALLVPFAGPDKILPERFLTVTAAELALGGWDALGDTLCRHDRPGRPITALSISFGWPGEDVPQPDANGHLSPLIETGYYTDDAFPFSQSSREDLLEGYSYHGCTWTGDCEASDTALWLTGIDDLHGALAMLEARLLASEEPDDEGIRAGSLGACLLSVLLFQAVDARIAQGGMPRPLCVMAGSNGVYPYFDAPVAGFPEDARKAAEAAEDEAVVDAGIPAPRYSSLLVTGIPRARKRAVLVLAETADEEAARISRLRGLAHGESVAEPAPTDPVPDVAAQPFEDTVIAAVPSSPLLVKKPSGQSWDFREMLSPYEPDAASPEAVPLELDDDWDEVAPPEPEQEWGGEAPSEPEPDWGGTKPFEPEHDWGGTAPPEPQSDWGGDEPLAPEPDAADSEPLETARTWEEPAPIASAQEPEPALSASSGEAPVGPGFSLLESLRGDRQKPIFPLPDFHIVEEEEAETVLQAEAEVALELELEQELEPEPEPGFPAVAEAVAGPDAEPDPGALAESAPESEFEPDSLIAPRPVPETIPSDGAEPALSAWPHEPTWLREVEARILPKAPPSEPALPRQASVEPVAAKSLWAQVRDWWYGRR